MPAKCENMNTTVKVAQLVELLVDNQRVAGSNPVFDASMASQRRKPTLEKLKANKVKAFTSDDRESVRMLNSHMLTSSTLVQTPDYGDDGRNPAGALVYGAFTAAGQLARGYFL